MGARIMFHVGGIAALTLLVNATTAAPLLRYLGLARRDGSDAKSTEREMGTSNIKPIPSI
jgi:hypothetical protein